MYKILDWIANNRRLAIILGVFLTFLIILVLVLLLSGTDRRLTINSGAPYQGSSESLSLNWWVSENDSIDQQSLTSLTSKFQEKYPSVQIQVTAKQDDKRFLEDFLSNPDDQPDIMSISSKNIAFYQKYAMSNQYFQNKELAGDYFSRSVETVKNNNVFSGEVFGVPLSVDNMQMYVNKNLLNNLAGNKIVAQDWETLKVQATSFDKSRGQNLIALGTTEEVVTKFEDVIGAMMVQKSIYLDSKNQEINDANFSQVLKDYTYFKQFQSRQDTDYDAFKQGKTLYYIDYYSVNERLKRENPSLDFEIADLPKYSNGNKISHSTFTSTMAHKKNKNSEIKKRIIDDFIYFLSLEDTQRLYSTKSNFPSANKVVASEQYKSKSDIDNNRRFFDQAQVARAIIPACPVKYKSVLSSLILAINSKGNNPIAEEVDKLITSYKSDLRDSVFTQNVCLPYKFQ
jgi:ABC-type glycerol-3-phosphate transport system substrate-binding protein